MVRVAAVEACGQALSPGTCRCRVARAVAFVLLFLPAIPLPRGGLCPYRFDPPPGGSGRRPPLPDVGGRPS
ncbi:hypothetical protein [Methanoculleus chikugoensis]|uniref:hypothetical protein n=1 Tax=Methanoculleus chikugoensis TaxID=118126 RepID=UPI0011815B9F|nr:hypothetical protein [Methanoculleus chikugoensis]NMA10530.1 hypothetical protein [Methanomicrobiales archaeon]